MNISPGAMGKYELRERLGQGGMAEVWKAFDQRLQRFVAIKFMHTALQDDPTFLSRFVREAQAVASLHHPNIVQIYDFESPETGDAEQRAYMVMDYIEGQTLAKYLLTHSRARQFLAPEDLVSLMYAICDAVNYAHQKGLLHRDIKPANILLDQRRTTRNPMGEPILTDFGIAKILGTASGTLTSSAVGTPLYISPEQAMGKDCSEASDIYSLGVILYEICTGTTPFHGDSPLIVLQQHVTAALPAPEEKNADISPELSAVITRALAKNPDERFPTALALAEAVAEALDMVLPVRQSGPISSPDIRELPTLFAQPAIGKSEATELLASAKPAANAQALNDTPVVNSQVAGSSLGVSEPATPTPEASELTTPPQQALPGKAPVAPRERGRQRRNKILVILSAVLLLVLLGSGLGIFWHARSAGNPTSNTQGTANALVGHAFFTSSGDGNGAQNQGINDMFQVQLTNVPAPASGQQYYAWLLPDLVQVEGNPLALGPLTVSGGVATLPSPYMDPQHQNLLNMFSRFLVTEEPANPAPQSPSLDTALWRYSAQLPQKPPLADCQRVVNQLSVLCHLRHLLASDPELARVNLEGGLAYWTYNNVSEVQKWARESMDHNDPTDIRHKLVNILSLLVGPACIAQALRNANPAYDNTPDDSSLPTIGAIPLLSCAQTPNLPGYLEHIHNHLSAMVMSPGVQRDQVTMARSISSELNTISAWLAQVRDDAEQLLALSNAQLMQTQGENLRSKMDSLATKCLSGGTDPASGMLDKGVVSIIGQIQQLATMDVTRYHAH